MAPGAVFILGVDGVGLESANGEMIAGKVLPWLQDTVEVDAWGRWNVTYRDVVIVNKKNEAVSTYNLTDHDLATQDNYERLKLLLLSEL